MTKHYKIRVGHKMLYIFLVRMVDAVLRSYNGNTFYSKVMKNSTLLSSQSLQTFKTLKLAFTKS